VDQLSAIAKTYKRLHRKGLDILGIDLESNETIAKSKAIQRRIGMSWSEVTDDGTVTNENFVPDGHGIPMNILLDRHGKIAAVDVPAGQLTGVVERLLRAKN
jgi:hypothetical protein